MRAKVAGAVLAAGAGSRMGRPKATLRIEGRTLLARLSSALRAGGCDPILLLVAGDLDRGAVDPIEGAAFVINPDPSRGQISSLRCAMEAASDAAGLLYVLVDQADIAPETVAAVLSALAEHPAAVASFRMTPGHPLAFRRDLFLDLFSRRADGGARAVVDGWRRQGWLAQIETADEGVTRNLNTPQDFERYRAQSQTLGRIVHGENG